MLDFRDEEEDQRAALALVEVSGEDDADDVASGQAVVAKESAREKIDRRRRERLDKSLARLRTIMEESRHWLDFRESQFRAAIECSLRLMEIEGGLTAGAGRTRPGAAIRISRDFAREKSHAARDA